MHPKPTPLILFRSALYYAGMYPATLIYAIICLILGPLLPFRARFAVLSSINYFYIAWLRICCGVRVQVEGRKTCPARAPMWSWPTTRVSGKPFTCSC